MNSVLHNGVIYRVLPVFLVFNFLFSCCNNPIEESKKRNILFYIGADESLIADDAPEKINQMRLGWQPGMGEMLIYIDKLGDGAYLYRINETKDANGYYGLDTIKVYGEENSADSKVLARVINEVRVGFPADSYGMIFFSHASVWLPEGTLKKPRSLVIDNDNGGGNREMEYYDFAAAIPDKQFDFIIFEACLMADVMSMYELRNKAEYVLVSSAEIVSPGFVYIYKDNIMNLFNPNISFQSILTSFAQSYINYVSSFSENDYRNSSTLSLLKMDEMENLASVTKVSLQGMSVDETNLTIDNIQSFDRPNALSGQSKSRYYDLADVMENLIPASRYKSFNEQLEKTVIWKVSTKRFFSGQPGSYYINKHCGLTTYIEQDVFSFINSEYKKSAWYKATQ